MTTNWRAEAKAACADYDHDHLITAQEAKRAYLKRALAALEAADELVTALEDQPDDVIDDAIAVYRKALTND